MHEVLVALTVVAASVFVSAAPARGGTPAFCQGEGAAEVPNAFMGPRIQGVALAIERERFFPGEKVHARLLNLGGSIATYGMVNWVERYSESRWRVEPAGPRGPWFMPRIHLQPGAAGSCFHWFIPKLQASGTYRFVVPMIANGVRSTGRAVFQIR